MKGPRLPLAHSVELFKKIYADHAYQGLDVSAEDYDEQVERLLASCDEPTIERILRSGREGRGKITADRSQQRPSNTYSPLTVYVDDWYECGECGKLCLWTAEEQRWWYEVVKAKIQTRAVRCRECRERKKAKDANIGGESGATS